MASSASSRRRSGRRGMGPRAGPPSSKIRRRCGCYPATAGCAGALRRGEWFPIPALPLSLARLKLTTRVSEQQPREHPPRSLSGIRPGAATVTAGVVQPAAGDAVIVHSAALPGRSGGGTVMQRKVPRYGGAAHAPYLPEVLTAEEACTLAVRLWRQSPHPR